MPSSQQSTKFQEEKLNCRLFSRQKPEVSPPYTEKSKHFQTCTKGLPLLNPFHLLWTILFLSILLPGTHSTGGKWQGMKQEGPLQEDLHLSREPVSLLFDRKAWEWLGSCSQQYRVYNRPCKRSETQRKEQKERNWPPLSFDLFECHKKYFKSIQKQN